MIEMNEAAVRVGEFRPIIFCAQRLLAAGKVMGVCWESCNGGRSEMGLPVILMTLTKKTMGGLLVFILIRAAVKDTTCCNGGTATICGSEPLRCDGKLLLDIIVGRSR